MKKSFLYLRTFIFIAPCIFLLGGCGDAKTYYATIGAHEHLTITSTNEITDGKIKFNKDSNFGLYLNVDHGYDPKTVEVKIDNALLTPSEVGLQTASYVINSYTKDVTLEITSPQAKVAGVYDFLEIRKASDDSKFQGDYDDIVDIGWTYGSAVQLTLETNNTLRYNAGNPEPISTGDYWIVNNILSFTPIGEAAGSIFKKETPFTPGYIEHTFTSNEYYAIFKLNYVYVI